MTTSAEPDKIPYRRLDIGRPSAENNNIWPQVEGMSANYRWSDADSIGLLTQNAPLETTPNFDSFCINPETNLTDALSQSLIPASGILISTKFHNALSKFVIEPHVPYEAKVSYRENYYDYIWMHFVETAEDHIDFRDSDLYIKELGAEPENFICASADEFRRKSLELANNASGSIAFSSISIRPAAPVFDLFVLSAPETTFFISERLGERLKNAELTGYTLGKSRIGLLVTGK